MKHEVLLDDTSPDLFLPAGLREICRSYDLTPDFLYTEEDVNNIRLMM